MASIAPYLAFNGNCREAFGFYGQVFGAEPFIQTFGESPVDASEDAKGLVMHTHLDAGSIQLMASDAMPGQPPVEFGSNVSLSVNCDSEEQQTRLFNALAEGGTVTMPLQDVFWGARFGMCTDKFGVHWMFNLDRPTG
jgi:PhnB protein